MTSVSESSSRRRRRGRARAVAAGRVPCSDARWVRTLALEAERGAIVCCRIYVNGRKGRGGGARSGERQISGELEEEGEGGAAGERRRTKNSLLARNLLTGPTVIRFRRRSLAPLRLSRLLLR